MKNFRELIIWNQGVELAVHAYDLTKQLPREEVYELASQIKRAVVSVPSNIAEGCSRATNKDFIKFLRTSLGSAFELETDLIIADRLKYIKSADVQKFLSALHIEQRQINTYMSTMRGK
jgi:four helix bundle protein